MNDKEVKAITSRDVDFAKWYTDVVRAAKLADYTSVKGCIAIEPNGYAIWEKIQSIMDKKFKELGHVNVQMPLLIPENLFNQEKELSEDLELLDALRLSVKQCEEIMEKNKDRFPILERANRILKEQNKQIKEDIAEVKFALEKFKNGKYHKNVILY